MRTRSASINNRGEQRFGKKYASSHGYRIAGLKLLPIRDGPMISRIPEWAGLYLVLVVLAYRSSD